MAQINSMDFNEGRWNNTPATNEEVSHELCRFAFLLLSALGFLAATAWV